MRDVPGQFFSQITDNIFLSDSYEVQIVSKLPKLVFRASSNKVLPKKKSKIMRQDDLIKMQKETEQNLQKAIERMERKYNDICKLVI